MREPVDAIAALEKAAAASKRASSVTLPIEYVRDGAGSPPVAVMARTSETRLKLHLLLVMQATRFPYYLPDRPSSTLARSLDVSDRQAADAKRWLMKNGHMGEATLVSGRDGLGLLLGGRQWQRGARYVRVPLVFWSNAWILALDGVQIAVLLALLELNGGSTHPEGEWMDGFRKKQYGLSDDSWTRATAALKRYGLIDFTTVYDGNDDHEIRRRTRYRVLQDGLEQRPDWASVSPRGRASHSTRQQTHAG